MKHLLAITLALSLTGCALLSQLAGSRLLSTALDLASAGSQAYFDKHPSLERQQAIRALYLAVRRAHAAHAKEPSPETQAAVDDAYLAYYELLGEYGILSAQGPIGGAEGDGPPPEPLRELVTPEELAAAW